MTAKSRLRILIVDDYGSSGALVQRNLERSGYAEIRAVCSPFEALSLIRREEFDLIISDHEMPGMTGLELLAAIRADPDMDAIRFMMLTCSDDRELLRQAMALGVDAYHTKPIARKTLDESVTRLGAGRGSAIGSSSDIRLSTGKIAPLHFGRAVERSERDPSVES